MRAMEEEVLLLLRDKIKPGQTISFGGCEIYRQLNERRPAFKMGIGQLRVSRL